MVCRYGDKAHELDNTAGGESSLSRMWFRTVDELPRACLNLGDDSPGTDSTNRCGPIASIIDLFFAASTFSSYVQVAHLHKLLPSHTTVLLRPFSTLATPLSAWYS
jgi:hypothetical protein